MPAFSLGFVATSTPGTPVRITSNQSEPAKGISCGSVMVQALSTNVSLVYVGGPTLNTTSGVGVLAILPVPTANSLPAFSVGNPTNMAGFNAAELWVDSTSSTNRVLASYVR